jgi:hypothetical protein
VLKCCYANEYCTSAGMFIDDMYVRQRLCALKFCHTIHGHPYYTNMKTVKLLEMNIYRYWMLAVVMCRHVLSGDA